MDKPIVIKNVLNEDLFCTIHDTMHKHMKWKLNNRSYHGGNAGLSWGVYPRNADLIFYEAASIIKLKILKHIRHKVQLIKLHYNGQTSGQISEFHADFDENFLGHLFCLQKKSGIHNGVVNLYLNIQKQTSIFTHHTFQILVH